MFLVVIAPMNFVSPKKGLMILVLLCDNVLTGWNDAQLPKILGGLTVVIGNY